MTKLPIFDLDGTLVDSDAALQAPFALLGVDPATIPLGLPFGEACEMAGVTVADYLAAYDHTSVQPFPGVAEMLATLDVWAVCSNKAKDSGLRELDMLGWSPSVAMFSEDFGGRPKQLLPVLEVLSLRADEVLFVGDTSHDRVSAAAANVRFALAGWNPRVRPEPGDLVLDHPGDLTRFLDGDV